MVGVAAIAAGATSVALGIFYQFVLKDQFFMLGITRHPQIIQEFPDYTCWRLGNELLQGCEDLWLDHQGRRLYAACSDSKGRDAWSPGLVLRILFFLFYMLGCLVICLWKYREYERKGFPNSGIEGAHIMSVVEKKQTISPS